MLRAALLTLLLSPAAALACKIAPERKPSLFSPPNGSANVPLNVELKVVPGSGSVTDATLIANGSESHLVLAANQRGRTAVFRPDVRLEPMTQYVFRVVVESVPVELSFTTGTGVDETPPVLSGEPSARAEGGPTPPAPLLPCNPSSAKNRNNDQTTFTWPTVSDDLTPDGEVWLEGFVGETVETLGAEPAAVGVAPTLVVGDLETMNRAFVRARAVDWAGNVSELSELQSAKNDCGCSSGAPGALAGLALLLFGRRRARR
ncbi:MAG: hypothetical protein JNK82_23620 [Myxococcaceae bacterium]|nr:hypothetical protein [Myxococcaceae bacterium]